MGQISEGSGSLVYRRKLGGGLRRMRINMALRRQVGLKPAQKRNAIATLSLQRPVAVEPLHELALSGYRQVTGDFAEPREETRI